MLSWMMGGWQDGKMTPGSRSHNEDIRPDLTTRATLQRGKAEVAGNQSEAGMAPCSQSEAGMAPMRGLGASWVKLHLLPVCPGTRDQSTQRYCLILILHSASRSHICRVSSPGTDHHTALLSQLSFKNNTLE